MFVVGSATLHMIAIECELLLVPITALAIMMLRHSPWGITSTTGADDHMITFGSSFCWLCSARWPFSFSHFQNQITDQKSLQCFLIGGVFIVKPDDCKVPHWSRFVAWEMGGCWSYLLPNQKCHQALERLQIIILKNGTLEHHLPNIFCFGGVWCRTSTAGIRCLGSWDTPNSGFPLVWWARCKLLTGLGFMSSHEQLGISIY